ncbi:MAG: hypothetical protein KKH29_01550 [Candidatus Omnitrophica bacterium]|nr:hypothetical protein [Candidatus Omnitrophota bacterium]MCG2706026.1 hypothetical protein [Candidatus Omnitrophota bacterium]
MYTGQTHAMIYPCDCPQESDGGLARRATLIKELRKENPNTLVLDSGGFFAGGLTDEYTQNTQLDMQRTLMNLKAIELIKYDALTLGDDEFNFGKDFLLENIAKIKPSPVSCNILTNDPKEKPPLFEAYIIKEVAGVKIGIIGVTGLSARQKAFDLKFSGPKIAIRGAVEELKKKNADIIILLSQLGEDDDLRLIKEIAEIDVVFSGRSRRHGNNKEELYSKIDSVLVLRPSWQGRRLGKLSLTLKDKKIIEHKVEELRLSDEIKDDPEMLSILPRCFSDANCKQEGMIGACQKPGTGQSECLFTKASGVTLSIITPKICSVCDSQDMIKFLKTQFPGLVVSYLYYPDARARKFLSNFNIKALPAYLLGKEVDKEKGFDKLKENLEIKGDFYMVKPEFSGFSYFPDRKKIKKKLDLFISLYDRNARELLEMTREFNPAIHFLAVEQEDKFDAPGGRPEVQEYLRSVCVQKNYPRFFWDYIICRAKNIDSSWWEDCLSGLAADKISSCSRSEEGKRLLKDNISLNKELKVMFGPTYLLDNQEIFSLRTVPKKEEFKKIIKR